jgi:hypothetical protein
LSALAFVFTVVTVSVGYAAWTALDRNAAATGQTVTSSLMQAVIDDVNDLNSRVSNFSFSGGNVGIGTTTPSAKLEVSGVIARTGCPTGMVSAGPYCIDSAERAVASWNAASDACYAENKHLCSVNEWSSACRRSLFSRSGNWNWTDNAHEQYWGVTYYYYTVTLIGTTDCNNMNWSYANAGTPYPYRCCADRVVGGN